jgi:hypothetical protein
MSSNNRYGQDGRALTNAERQRRFRDRHNGKKVPMGRAGRPKSDRFAQDPQAPFSLPTGYYPPSEEAVQSVAELLASARLEDGAGAELSDTRKTEQELLKMVRGA